MSYVNEVYFVNEKWLYKYKLELPIASQGNRISDWSRKDTITSRLNFSESVRVIEIETKPI